MIMASTLALMSSSDWVGSSFQMLTVGWWLLSRLTSRRLPRSQM